MNFRCIGFALLGLVSLLAASASAQDVVREDRRIPLASGEHLFVREVRSSDPSGGPRPAVLLLHGARVPGLASFDLPVPGGSLAADLARAGYAAYVLDLRGYGNSSRPAAMEAAPAASAPLVRTADAVADIGAAVAAIRQWNGGGKVSLLGWATGGHWVGAYASQHPEGVHRIIIYNSLYGGSSEHPTLGHGSPLEAPGEPGMFNAKAFGAYRLNSAASLFTAWDQSIPVEDKSAWRDEAVARAYALAALASDPTSSTREPPSFRSPSGAMADSYELAIDRRQWSAAALTMPVLVIRSERDFWSRPADAGAIVEEAPRAELVVISGGTHFVHLDRDDAGRRTFLSAVLAFLRS